MFMFLSLFIAHVHAHVCVHMLHEHWDMDTEIYMNI
jgi:hypothetical protein